MDKSARYKADQKNLTPGLYISQVNGGITTYDMRFLKPLDQDIMEEVSSCKAILTVEDGSLKGGLYGAVSEYFAARPDAPIIKGVGIPDKFVVQDTQKAQREECGLDTESLFDLLREMMKNV